MIDKMLVRVWKIGSMVMAEDNLSARRELVPLPLFLVQVPHGLA